MSRSLVCLALMGTVSSSFASFEMLLAADFNSVHRYDIEHGVYLGSFSSPMLSDFRGVVAKASTGQAFVYTNTEIHRFNYHTGAYQGSFTPSGFDIRHVSLMNNGDLMITNSTTSTAYNPDTGAAGFSLNYFAGDVPMGAVQFASGKFIALSTLTSGSTVTNFQNRFSSSGVRESSTSMANTSIPNMFVGIGRVGNRAAMWGANASAVVAGSYRTVDQTGGLFSHGTGVLSGDTYTVTSGQTHNGDLISVSKRWNGTRWINGIQFARNGVYQYVRASSDLPMITEVMGADVVLAPEPGTMIALLGGAAAILRRRRRR